MEAMAYTFLGSLLLIYVISFISVRGVHKTATLDIEAILNSIDSGNNRLIWKTRLRERI
jgi:hypothetical protein